MKLVRFLGVAGLALGVVPQLKAVPLDGSTSTICLVRSCALIGKTAPGLRCWGPCCMRAAIRSSFLSVADSSDGRSKFAERLRRNQPSFRIRSLLAYSPGRFSWIWCSAWPKGTMRARRRRSRDCSELYLQRRIDS